MARRAAAAGLEPPPPRLEGPAGSTAQRAGVRREALPGPLAGQPARAIAGRAGAGEHRHRRHLHR